MDVTVIKSNRKTVSIQVNADLSVVVRAPRRATKRDIDRILREKESWILKHIEQMRIKAKEYKAMHPQPTDKRIIAI